MIIGIVELYCGKSGAKGFYNSQEIGLAKAYEQLGHSCVIFYPNTESKLIREEKVSGHILTVLVPAQKIGVHSRFSWEIIKRYSVEVLQINSDNQIFAPDLSKFCEKNKIRQYHYIGTVNSDRSSGVAATLMRVLFRRNLRMLRKQKCFAKTREVRDKLSEMKISNIQIAPVGLDLSIIPLIVQTKKEIRKKIDLPQDKKLILFVGRIDSYKNPFEALKLIQELPQEYDLVIIGTGALDSELKRLIEQENLHHRIHWTLQLPNVEMHDYYHACDYFVNFNRHEIFGMSILEAMLGGETVLAYHAPGPDEILRDEKCGILVDRLEEMKQLIISGRECDSEYVKSFVKREFTWQRTAEVIQDWMLK